jgi:adenylate cyclase class 2
MSGHGREVEIKLAMPGVAKARALLRGEGFRIFRRRVFESNTVFDTADGVLRNAGRLLRVRTAGKAVTLTYKGVATPGRHKSREEIETGLTSEAAGVAILASLGYLPLFRYEKYRTEYHQGNGGGIAMLDETPVGVYLELEGAPRWIDATAKRLGFKHSDYILDSYGRLYFSWCEARGEHPTHMVFRGKRR